MNYAHRLNLSHAFLCMLAPDKGGGAGGSPKTIEQQLTDSKSELETLKGQITSLTGERDTARNDVTQLRSQFDELTKTANKSKEDLTTSQNDLTRVNGELNDVKGKLTKADENVSRLEKLCGVKGLDPKGAPQAASESSPGEHVFDKWMSATGSEKMSLFRAHKSEIRAEAQRRGINAGN